MFLLVGLFVCNFCFAHTLRVRATSGIAKRDANTGRSCFLREEMGEWSNVVAVVVCELGII